MTPRSLPKKVRKASISSVRSFSLDLDSEQSVWVIPDIHACFLTLRELIRKIPESESSRFIFLGDYVNKGTRPVETLTYLVELSQTRNCLFLRGNHDQMMLDAWTLPEPVYKNQIVRLGSQPLLDKQAQFLSFYENTFHYLSTQTHLLVHAGFDFQQKDPYQDVERMMMIREIDYVADKAMNKTVVRGHYPFSYQNIIKDLQARNRVISLDNGCVYADRQDMGNLLALELNSYELIVQENVD